MSEIREAIQKMNRLLTFLGVRITCVTAPMFLPIYINALA
jgi:hypothetical protein